jgi:hypothetical protein
MYPERLIRGIPNKTYLDEETVSAHLFYFNKMAESKKEDNQSMREDGFYEESINWYDNEKSLQILLQQTKLVKENSEIQFKAGAAILNRRELDHIRNRHILINKYTYERKAIEGNVYHGNLLCHSDISTKMMKMVAQAIALLCVEEIVPPSSL